MHESVMSGTHMLVAASICRILLMVHFFGGGGTSSEVFPETLEEVMSLCNPGTSTSQLFNLCKLISCKSLYQLQPIEIGSLCDKN